MTQRSICCLDGLDGSKRMYGMVFERQTAHVNVIRSSAQTTLPITYRTRTLHTTMSLLQALTRQLTPVMTAGTGASHEVTPLGVILSSAVNTIQRLDSLNPHGPSQPKPSRPITADAAQSCSAHRWAGPTCSACAADALQWDPPG